MLFALAAGLLGCLSGEAALTPLPPGGMHVLFIGNSLTYVNELPRTLADLALTSGDTVQVAEVAYPDFALVDHLAPGNAMAAIKTGGWKYVVLQQGPSSVQINRDSLILMTKLFDAAIRAVGGKTALYSVWPQYSNFSTFERAIESYRLAAESVTGVYLPVGAAWLAAWDKDALLPLYNGDGLHPSELGTYLAAAVMYEQFTGKDARLLPAKAVVNGRTLSTPEATIRLLQLAAHETNLKVALK